MMRLSNEEARRRHVDAIQDTWPGSSRIRLCALQRTRATTHKEKPARRPYSVVEAEHSWTAIYRQPSDRIWTLARGKKGGGHSTSPM